MRGKLGLFSRTEVDFNFSDVTLLLHMEGSNGSTTFTDSSSSPKTVTAAGNVQLSTAQSKFGEASALFDGNGDYLQVASTSALDFPGDFTVEFWVRTASNPDVAGLVARRVLDSSGAGTWGILLDDGLAVFWNLGSVTPTSFGTVSLNTWTHMAVSRSGSSLRLFLNGELNVTLTDSSDFSNSQDMFIGGWDRSGAGSVPTQNWFDGYIDEFRITKGFARYTAAFTPPTGPFPED
jgi:hypothetical protein